MSREVVIVDYGMGNLLSVSRAFGHVGAETVVTDSAERIATAERLVLPGVGAFADGMQELHTRHLIEPIRAFCAGGRPFLGICLGMQMMMDSSLEFGAHAGLGLVPGHVVAVPAVDCSGAPQKVPHIGWNCLQRPPGVADWSGTPLQDTEEGASVYFVHSYIPLPTSRDHALATTSYGGHSMVTAIRRGSLFGVQFHPEKSGPIGLRIIRAFVAP